MRELDVSHNAAVVSLFGAVCSERQRRRAPAVLALSRLDQQRSCVSRQPVTSRSTSRILFRCLRTMLRESAHFSSLSAARIVLARKSHKFTEAKQELQDCGVDQSQLTHLPRIVKRSWFVDLVFGRFKIMQNTATLVYLWRRVGTRLMPFLELICMYSILTRECRALSCRYWLVVGDLSPFQIALAAAVRRTGHRLLTWQYDYLDFKRFPVVPDVAAVLNNSGAKLARIDSRADNNERLYWRSGIACRTVNLSALADRPVGVLLNAFSAAHVVESVLTVLRDLLRQSILIRRHPNSKLAASDLIDDMEFQPVGESMDDFVRKVGIVVSGNTSAQLKALCLGAPIVQVPGLDPMNFDHHGYVARGIVYGVPSPDSISIESLVRFYRGGEFEENLAALLGPPPASRVPTTRDLVPVLNQC